MVDFTRREFINITLLTTAAMTTGCTRRTGGSALTDLPHSVWEQVRSAVRASPDHLPAGAARAVATGDPEQIFAFVRDRISVLPPAADGFAQSVGGRRWGVRGTLRCGFGTPRERADLLADLFEQAGLEAEVVEGSLTADIDPDALMARRFDLSFAPPVDATTVEQWHRALEIDAAGPLDRPDPDVAAELADLLMATLGPIQAEGRFDPGPPARVPLVRVLVDGQEHFANPLLPDTRFGESLVDSPVTALSGDLLAGVRLALSYARTDNPAERIVLAERGWEMEEVIGRQLYARFIPSGGVAEMFRTPLDAIPCFTAVIGLDGPDFGPDQMDDASTVGDSITVFGNRIQTSDLAPPVVDGEPVGGDPEAADRVSDLTVSVSASAFPTVLLRVGAADASGAPVLDIPAEAFVVDDGGTPVSFTLTASHAPTPSVLMLFDGSRSLPAEFRDEGAVELAAGLARDLLSRYPATRFRLGGINFGTASLSPAWLATVAEVEAEADRVITDGSELWQALADARGAGANVVVLVTDGQATDTDEQRAVARPWVHGGPPVVVIGVGDFDSAGGEDIAATSGGISVAATNRTAAIDAVAGFLATTEAVPYRTQYRAPVEGPPDRVVRVTVGGVSAEVPYTVPTQPLVPPAVSGLYLTIAIGSQEVTRTLAGVPWEDATPTTAVPPEMLDEVRQAMVGGAVVSIEAGPPTASVWLDDFLTAKLSQRPLYERRADGIDAQIEALSGGVHSLPLQLPALQGPPLGGDPAVIPTGLHAVLLAGRPLPGGVGLSRADVLPFSGWVSPAPGVEGFTDTLRTTALLSVGEAWLYSDSTMSRLQDRPLEVIPALVSAPLAGVNERWARLLDHYSAYHRIVPGDAGPFAFWAVDANGSMLGVLADGSGGGSDVDAIGEQCGNVSRIAAATQLSGAGLGLPFAGLVSLQKAISLQVLRAAAVIATLDDPQIPPACDKGLGDLACDWAKDTLAAATWTGYGAIDTADDVVEAAGGGGLVNC